MTARLGAAYCCPALLLSLANLFRACILGRSKARESKGRIVITVLALMVTAVAVALAVATAAS